MKLPSLLALSKVVLYLPSYSILLTRSLHMKNLERIGEYRIDLDYADDICLLAYSYTDMQTKLDRIVHEAIRVDLEINM